MLRVLVMCLCLYVGTSQDNVRELCRRVLLNSQFQVNCADTWRWHPWYYYKRPCKVETEEDADFLRKAEMQFIYEEPGVTAPKICVALRNKWKFGECVTAPKEANSTVGYSFTGWKHKQGVWHNQLRLKTGELCPYESVARENYNLEVTADNFGEVYIDGKFISRDLKWPTVSKYLFMSATKVMAFVTWNLGKGGASGLRAYLNKFNVKTDDKSGWVCSEEYEENWEKVAFDDSHWTPVNVDYAGDKNVVGHDAVTIGCLGRGEGAEYFRIKLNYGHIT